MIFLATSIPHGSRLLLLVSRLWLWLPGCTLPGCVPWILWCCTFCIPHIAQGVDSKPYLTYHGCVMYCFKEELLDPCSYCTFPYTFPYCFVHFHGALKGMDCLPYCFHVSICRWVWQVGCGIGFLCMLWPGLGWLALRLVGHIVWGCPGWVGWVCSYLLLLLLVCHILHSLCPHCAFYPLKHGCCHSLF